MRQRERDSVEVMKLVQPAGETQTHAHAADNKLPQSSTCHSSGSLMLISPLLVYFSLRIIIPHLCWLAVATNLQTAGTP